MAAAKRTTKGPPTLSLKLNKIQQNKRALVKAMTASRGIVTDACLAVGLDRGTFYNYYNSDPAFKAEIDGIEDIALDFVESSLHRQIEDGEVAATIFYLKTKGKKRGYIEKSQVEIIHTAEMAAKHYAQALDFAVRFALAPGEKTHATALAMLAENAKGNADLEAVVAELAEKMNVKQISA